MALQSSFYPVDGRSRTYPQTKHIPTKQHAVVYSRLDNTNDWVLLADEGWSLINNSIVLREPFSASVYDQIEVRVGDKPSELTDSISNIATVAGIANEIVSIVTDKATIDSIYADKATLDSIYADKIKLDSLYADKATLDSLFADKIKLNSLYADKAKLDSLYADKATLDSLFADKATLDAIYADRIGLTAIYTNLTAVLDAANQAAAAAASAAAASASAGNAATSESNAAASAGSASTSASNASASALSASNSASSASASASNASTSETNAAASESNAATSETNAATSASNAATSETNAAASALEAASYADYHLATEKTTPVDADEMPLVDSAASWGLKKVTWGNIKATLKTYFDTIYGRLTVANSWTAQQTFKELKETVYNLTGTSIDPANGTIQSKTLSGNTTFTEVLESGQSVTLRLANGASYTVTFPTVTWYSSGGNVAPTLTANDLITFWKEGTTLYGKYGGNAV